MLSSLPFAAAAVVALARLGSGFAPPTPRGLPGPASTAIPSSPSSLRMFTGIVEEMGEVLSLEKKDDMILWDGTKGSGTEMVVKGDVVMDGAYLGCSISVNGVCLTATELDPEGGTFRVGLAPETLRKTNLGTYASQGGSKRVNLERASEIGGRNSGHFVQGHVDDVGTIVDRWTDENSLFFKVALPYEIMRYVVPKGFIAIDGTSLTVCDVTSEGPGGENWFTFMLVEYTQAKIIVPTKVVGDTVNIEVDVLGKYSARAWETFAPKMEALERRVQELEAKLAESEGRGGQAGDEVAPTSEGVARGDVVPGGFASSLRDALGPKPETWAREEQPTMSARDLVPEKEGRDRRGTDWVRTEQTYYDTNY